MLGIISAGSVVRILPEDAPGGAWVQAAIGDGFLSVADNRVSILARQAVLGGDVDKASARAGLEEAQASQSAESAAASYLRAQLRAAGDEA